MALSKMGSSVFHGGFSTFVALSVLAPAKTYIFVVFYKMWFGIILFGMANGFLLLPIALSFIGSTNTVTDHTAHQESDEDSPERTLQGTYKHEQKTEKNKLKEDVFTVGDEIGLYDNSI